MEAAVPVELDIGFVPESLSEGMPEEKAAFGLFTIQTQHGSLTEGWDHFLGGSRLGPLVSAYHVAEWFAWNWWRLRWEPRRSTDQWQLAHNLTSVGEGYSWPDLTIFSDGERTALISSASSDPNAKPFRYFGSNPAIVSSLAWESAVDEFIGQVLSRLGARNVQDSNLQRIWNDIIAEREDPDIARRRKLEALLGRDPDEIDDNRVERLVADEEELGRSAVEEVAADLGDPAVTNFAMLGSQQLKEIAQDAGFDSDIRDVVSLNPANLPRKGLVPAWKLGATAATQLREQEKLAWDRISDHRLVAMAGCSREVLARNKEANQPMSFSLVTTRQRGRIVLRSKWKGGRRFDLARLIGDSIFGGQGKLHPATRAYTYRQKAQRSFAAELLCPFKTLDEMLGGDYSPEAQQEAAEYFAVSQMTVNTQLMNHGRIERNDPETDTIAA